MSGRMGERRMLRNRFRFGKSVTTGWVLSYAVTLLIPLIVSAIIFTQTTQIVKYEIERASSAMLKQVKYIVDSELGQTEKLGTQIAIHSGVLQYLELDGETEAAHTYDIYRTGQELAKYKSANDFIRDIYIYSPRLDKVLTSSTHADSRLFYAMKHRSETYGFDQWYADLKGVQTTAYQWMPMASDALSRKTVVYVQPLGGTTSGEPSGKLIMPLNGAQIEQLLDNVDWVNRGSVYIVDAESRVLFQNDGSAEGAYDELLTSGSHIVNTVASDTAEWRYVSVFPSDVFWERAREIRTMNLIGLLACCLIGVAAVTYFTRRNYTPVKELVSLLPGDSTADAQVEDEYAYIRQSVQAAIRERDDMSNNQLRQLRVLQSFYLAKLLKGQPEQAMSVREAADLHRMDWPSEQFAVVLFHVYPSEEKALPLALCQFIVSNIVKDLADRHHNIVFTDADGLLAAIINIHPGRQETWKEDLEADITEAQDFIRARYGLTFAAAGSDRNDSLEGIHQAFLQALEAQEYRLMMDEPFVWYGDIKLDETDYFFSLNEELMLHNMIKSGEFDKASEMVDRMIGHSFTRQASLEMVRCFMIDLASTMMKMVPPEARTSALWEERRPVKRLLACTTRDEFRRELTAILTFVCERVGEKLSLASTSRIGERTAEFVLEHYADPNLSVSLIGSHFGITPQYVSRLFKEHAGEGLHEFISQTRVRAAKRLLDEGATIDETAARTGFSSSSAFIRVFKKYEGITPGKYKAIQ